jgi:hypothetical protein
VARVPTESIYTDTEPDPDWLIKDTIHKGNLILLAGLAGIGKSLFCYALANSLATSTHLLDGDVPPRRILYFDEENGRADLSAYARWTWRGLGSPSRDLLESHLRIESRTLSGSNAWNVTLRQLAGEFKPDLMILDTTTPACHIADENDNAEASAACQQVRLAMDTAGPDTAALLLKHLRVDTKTGKVDVRGAKHWKGAVDGIWYHLFSSGPKRADGWRNTFIRPEKSRAYGLHHDINIKPSSERGLFVKLGITRTNNSKSEA